MREFLKKLLIKNLMSVKSSYRTRSLLIWSIFPELRTKQVNEETLRSIKILAKNLTILILFILSAFSLGYTSHLIKSLDTYKQSKEKSIIIDSLKLLSSKKDSVIRSLREVSISRDYWNWKIISETGIKEVTSFKKLSDTVVYECLNQCQILDIPIKIFFRIMERESRFQFIKNKTGSGAFGYMQVMPGTFKLWYKKLKLTGGHNQINNIIVSANLLSSSYQFWKSTKSEAWRWALAEYACGREPLLKLGRIPDEVIPGIEKVLK